MLIKMTKTERGSEDGIIVQTYESEKEYEVKEDLAQVFIGMRIARAVTKSVQPTENKMVKPEENKDAKKEEVKDEEVKEDDKKDKKKDKK